jgi:glycosyltransferase involved in cell wall biosynthesis
MHRLLRELVRSRPFEVIHADQTSMAQYALYARSQIVDPQRRAATRLLLDAHNALYRVFSQLAEHEASPLRALLYRREARRLESYERRLVKAFDRVTYVSEYDLQALEPQRNASDSVPRVLPICIDLAERAPVRPCAAPNCVTCLGTMFWPPNAEGVLWFGNEVWPSVVARVPDARFLVIGKHPPPRLQALASGRAGIEVLGYVSDPEPYLAQTAAFVVPLQSGAGMRVKIVDGWCWGLPVVSTTDGAEGILGRDGEHLLIADDPGAFADSVVVLLTQSALRKRLRRQGRQWVGEHYDWRKVYKQWDAIYASMLEE